MQRVVEQLLAFLENIGVIGLYIAIFLEGTSLPFPGIAVVLTYGGLLDLGMAAMGFVSAAMALIYSLASLLPYVLGDKLEAIFPNKFKKGISQAAGLFKRYGIWSIAISRPFGIGNYISYLAGMSRVGLVKFLTLTFIGIYPWCLTMLYLGSAFNGNYDKFLAFYREHSTVLYGTVIFLFTAFLVFSYWKYQKDKNS